MGAQTPYPLDVMQLSGLSREDVGVTSIQNGHDTAAEELTASGTELNLCEIVSK